MCLNVYIYIYSDVVEFMEEVRVVPDIVKSVMARTACYLFKLRTLYILI
jgi:hypothetical protein